MYGESIFHLSYLFMCLSYLSTMHFDLYIYASVSLYIGLYLPFCASICLAIYLTFLQSPSVNQFLSKHIIPDLWLTYFLILTLHDARPRPLQLLLQELGIADHVTCQKYEAYHMLALFARNTESKQINLKFQNVPGKPRISPRTYITILPVA